MVEEDGKSFLTKTFETGTVEAFRKVTVQGFRVHRSGFPFFR